MYLPLEHASQMDIQFDELGKLCSGFSKIKEDEDDAIRFANSKDFYTVSYKGKYADINRTLLDIEFASRAAMGNNPKQDWKDIICNIAMLNKWSKSKQVYKFDDDFVKELVRTDGMRIYPDMLRHLPWNVFYIDFDGADMFRPFDGGFVSVIVEDNDDIYLTFSRLIGEVFFCSHFVFDEKIRKYEENGVAYYECNKDELDFPQALGLCNYLNNALGEDVPLYAVSNVNFDDVFIFLMQSLVYLASDKPEVQENEVTKKTYKPSRTVKNRFSEVRKWDVGVRYGQMIRATRLSRRETSGREYGQRKPTRPHVRKAHWHRYWYGKGRTQVKVLWLPPTYVSGTVEDISAVIHKVAN